MSKVRIKVSCAGIIDRCTVPEAVLVADIRIGALVERYVLVTNEVRNALSGLRREDSYGGAFRAPSYSEITHYPHVGGPLLPPLIRSHAFDSHGTVFEGRAINTFAGTWVSGEPLWVRIDLAQKILADLVAWRSRTYCGADSIHAPNWLCLIGCQALALAADLPLPQAVESGEASNA